MNSELLTLSEREIAARLDEHTGTSLLDCGWTEEITTSQGRRAYSEWFHPKLSPPSTKHFGVSEAEAHAIQTRADCRTLLEALSKEREKVEKFVEDQWHLPERIKDLEAELAAERERARVWQETAG